MQFNTGKDKTAVSAAARAAAGEGCVGQRLKTQRRDRSTSVGAGNGVHIRVRFFPTGQPAAVGLNGKRLATA